MNTPKPGDFPIGSVESRAAMRLHLSSQQAPVPAMDIVSFIPRPWPGEGPEPNDWNEVPRVEIPSPDVQILYVPPGMTEEEARKVTGARAPSLALNVRAMASRAQIKS